MIFIDAKEDYNAQGDGVTDDYAALQAAIDAAIVEKHRLILPVGIYKITQPLLARYQSGGAYGFFSLDIAGEVMPTTPGQTGAPMKQATIRPTFHDTFAFGIQNGRSIHMTDIAFEGTNDFVDTVMGNYSTMFDPATFIVGPVRNSRFSPYAGICIDPFGTSVPGDGGYPGMTDHYKASAQGSSRLTFERINARQFVVGVMITPNGTTQNAEDISFRDCVLAFNRTNLAIGQSQSRCVRWDNGNVAFALIGFDGETYGAQQGYCPKIAGANMNGKYLFNVGVRWGEVLVIRDVHAESFASIGGFGAAGAAASSAPVLFDGCKFGFSDFSGSGRYVDFHLFTRGPTAFESCQFDQRVSTQLLRFFHTEGIDYRNVVFSRGLHGEFPIAHTLNGVDSYQDDLVTYQNCTMTEPDVRGPPGGVPALVSTNLVANDAGEVRVNRSFAPPGMILRHTASTATPDSMIHYNASRHSDQTISLGTIALIKNANGTGTFTVSAADQSSLRLGDQIYLSGAVTYQTPNLTTHSCNMQGIGYVSGISGTTITITGLPESLTNGSYTLKLRWMPRLHMPSSGRTTSGSPVIEDVTNIGTWAVGHRIKGAGIPVGAHITSVDVPLLRITISKNATGTATGVRLHDANMYRLQGSPV